MRQVTVITVPGLGGSGAEHWQTAWENQDPDIKRVVQHDWDNPDLNVWMQTLESVVASAPYPVVLAAHSLSVSLVVHWAEQANGRVKGALLVAPADVDSPLHTPEETRGFSPIPLKALPFKSIVVASENDPYVDLSRARQFAATWGSTFVNVGALGHINSASNLGLWPQGLALLEELKIA